MEKLQGWWDEIGNDVKSLADTVVRTIDPQFDNKVALGKMLREDPTKQQGLVDMESLNPGILNQLYGSKIAENIIGTPSTGAAIEKAGRGLVGKDVKDIPMTFENSGALAKAGVKDQLDVKGQEADIEGKLQQTEFYKWSFDQQKWEASMKNPEIKARYESAQQARANFPELALIDPYKLAERWLTGNADQQEIDALSTLSPAGYEMFKTAVQDMGQNARSNQALEQDDKQFNARMAQENDAAERELLRFVRATTLETGLPFDAVYKHFKGETQDKGVQDLLDSNKFLADQTRRLGNMGKLNSLVKTYLQAKDKQTRDIAKGSLEVGLREIFNAPITIEKIPETDSWNPWDKKAAYTLPNGESVNGTELYEYATDPKLFAGIMEDTQVVSGLTPEQAKQELAAVTAAQNSYIAANGQKRYGKLIEALKKQAGGGSARTERRR